jgi:hypothetical protein
LIAYIIPFFLHAIVNLTRLPFRMEG